MGARNRSALPCATERRRVPLPRVGRAARAQPRRGRARAQPTPVRRVAASREPPRGRARAVARCPRDVRSHGRGSVRRARPARTIGYRRDGAQTYSRDARRAHHAGGASRPARCTGAYEPGDSRPAVHQPAHCRVPPAQGIPKARYQFAQGAPQGAPGRGGRRCARLTRQTSVTDAGVTTHPVQAGQLTPEAGHGLGFARVVRALPSPGSVPTADAQAELFFDLVYVFAITQLSGQELLSALVNEVSTPTPVEPIAFLF